MMSMVFQNSMPYTEKDRDKQFQQSRRMRPAEDLDWKYGHEGRKGEGKPKIGGFKGYTLTGNDRPKVSEKVGQDSLPAHVKAKDIELTDRVR